MFNQQLFGTAGKVVGSWNFNIGFRIEALDFVLLQPLCMHDLHAHQAVSDSVAFPFPIEGYRRQSGD
jgi:hypothetical protein